MIDIGWIEKKENRDGSGRVYFKASGVYNSGNLYVPVFAPWKNYLYFYIPGEDDSIISFYCENLEECDNIINLFGKYDKIGE